MWNVKRGLNMRNSGWTSAHMCDSWQTEGSQRSKVMLKTCEGPSKLNVVCCVSCSSAQRKMAASIWQKGKERQEWLPSCICLVSAVILQLWPLTVCPSVSFELCRTNRLRQTHPQSRCHQSDHFRNWILNLLESFQIQLISLLFLFFKNTQLWHHRVTLCWCWIRKINKHVSKCSRASNWRMTWSLWCDAAVLLCESHRLWVCLFVCVLGVSEGRGYEGG